VPRFGAIAGRLAAAGLEALLPADCLLCARPLPWRQRGGVCPPCWDRVPWSPGVRFGQSGLRALLWAADYDGPVRRLIRHLKFDGLDFLGRPLGEEMARRLHPLLTAGALGRPDAVVPVPLHWWRRARRGFNQAALVGVACARTLGLPLLPGALSRRGGGRQLGRTRRQRRSSLQDRFRSRSRPWPGGRAAPLAGRTILLVDDVVTTGATLEACAAALRDAGSGEVIGCAVARTPGRRSGAPPGIRD
jgi:ComF family protein